jgi:hypothetical protein
MDIVSQPPPSNVPHIIAAMFIQMIDIKKVFQRHAGTYASEATRLDVLFQHGEFEYKNRRAKVSVN